MKMQFIIEQAARRNGAHTALSNGTQHLSYADLDGEVRKYMRRLQLAGCTRLAIGGDNSIKWVLWDLAALCLDIPCVPLPPFFSDEQRRHVMDAAGISHIAENNNLIPAFSADPPAIPYGSAKITFTSGSTGAPKGVCLSQDGMLSVVLGIGERLGSALAGRHLCLLPLAILLENIAGVYTALAMGATVILPDAQARGMGNPFAPDFAQMLRCIEDQQASSIILVPELLRGLLGAVAQTGRRPASLRFAAVGGARVAPALLQQATALGLAVYEGYGLSECASVVSLNTPDDNLAGSAGKLLPHIQASVQDGELVVRNTGFLGYLGDAGPAPAWLHTGDLARIDAQGRLFLEGRKKNLIITSFARNVSPEWLESLLLAQPEIAQAITYGDGQPHISALIVPMRADADVTAAVARCNAQLPAYARIGNVRLVPPFTPDNGLLTGNGRPRREKILAAYTQEKTMSFYEKLQQQTAAARQELYSVPQLVNGLKGEISRETYIAYLTEAYHHVRHTVRFMMAMGVNLPESKKFLHDAIAEYIEEEKGHEEWILNDIAAAGGDKEAARASTPNLETQVLVAYNYDYIARKNPVGFLGMVFMLESTSTQIANQGADAIMTGLGLPKSAFSYLYSHGALDIEHLSFYEKLVNRIEDPADQAAIIEVANNTFRLFANVLRAIPMERSQRHAA